MKPLPHPHKAVVQFFVADTSPPFPQCLKLTLNAITKDLETQGWNHFAKTIAGPVDDSLAKKITNSALEDDMDRSVRLD